MKVIEKISEIIGKYMALIVLAVAALALFVPQSSLWIDTSWINYLLMIVMFGMGLTMKPKDFTLIFKRPKDIIIGCAAQFIIMPALAFGLSRIFGLDPALTAGVVLVGTCPGGTASNVMTYLSKGDVANDERQYSACAPSHARDHLAAAANDRQCGCLGDVLEHNSGDYHSDRSRLCH